MSDMVKYPQTFAHIVSMMYLKINLADYTHLLSNFVVMRSKQYYQMLRNSWSMLFIL